MLFCRRQKVDRRLKCSMQTFCPSTNISKYTAFAAKVDARSAEPLAKYENEAAYAANLCTA